jgi:hypothetical protein
MNEILPADQLEALRRFTTPTISNALERLGLPHSLDNQTDGSIRCIFSDLGVIVGYAITATIRSAASRNPNILRENRIGIILRYPRPRIATVGVWMIRPSALHQRGQQHS